MISQHIDALMAQCQRQESRIRELEAEIARLLEPQPCGHPNACIYGDGKGTQFCGWCIAESRANRWRKLAIHRDDLLTEILHIASKERRTP